MSENENQKRKCYYTGKKIPYRKFQDMWNMYGTHKISKSKAAVMIGVSMPTFLKYEKAVIENWGINRKLTFIDFSGIDEIPKQIQEVD